MRIDAHTDDLDGFILPSTVRAVPPRSEEGAWLSISQVALVNIRSLVNHGKSETADAVAAHYWRRWSEAPST